jgi:hypothetical protein
MRRLPRADHHGTLLVASGPTSTRSRLDELAMSLTGFIDPESTAITIRGHFQASP